MHNPGRQGTGMNSEDQANLPLLQGHGLQTIQATTLVSPKDIMPSVSSLPSLQCLAYLIAFSDFSLVANVYVHARKFVKYAEKGKSNACMTFPPSSIQVNNNCFSNTLFSASFFTQLR